MKEFTVGILGGMGSYATAHFFKKTIDAFPAEKEWERPRIVIDNRCTMPSRVRAILHNENTEELLDCMEESIRAFVEEYNADKIVLACNTSHYFYPELVKRIPELEVRGIHLIENCCNKLKELHIKEVGLIASEGTIESGIFNISMDKAGIVIRVPNEETFPIIRSVIEDVKQNHTTERTRDNLLRIIEMLNSDTVILGCTELPIVLERYETSIRERFGGMLVDPLQCAIENIIESYKETEQD